MNANLACNRIINQARYPVDQLDHPLRGEIIQQVKTELAADGCAIIRDFFSEEGLDCLLAEANARKPYTYYSPRKRCNIYLNDGDAAFAGDHPRNIFMPRTNGFITADLFEDDSVSHRLYYWEPLKRFLAECLGKEALFIYDDPVSNMIVNVAKPGQEFNWHFDTNEFTITMLLKPAESGGHFEYVAGLRCRDDECYDDVKKVLDGDRSRVRRLELNAGDLQFFLGRFSLHRVTRNTGDHDRLLLIMSFTEKPGVIGSIARVRNLYGKITDAHREQTVRADKLVD